MTKRAEIDPADQDRSTQSEDEIRMDRRALLKVGAAGLGLAALGACSPGGGEGTGKPVVQRTDLGPAPDQPFSSPPMELVRMGMVGVGLQGTSHVRNFLRIEGCQITAVCDVVPEHAERSATLVEEAGFPRPTVYTNGERDFERLCA